VVLEVPLVEDMRMLLVEKLPLLVEKVPLGPGRHTLVLALAAEPQSQLA